MAQTKLRTLYYKPSITQAKEKQPRTRDTTTPHRIPGFPGCHTTSTASPLPPSNLLSTPMKVICSNCCVHVIFYKGMMILLCAWFGGAEARFLCLHFLPSEWSQVYSHIRIQLIQQLCVFGNAILLKFYSAVFFFLMFRFFCPEKCLLFLTVR